MTMVFAHDNNISDLYVGKNIKQGEVFCQTGNYGYVTGVHSHVTCIRENINMIFGQKLNMVHIVHQMGFLQLMPCLFLMIQM